MRRTVQEKKEKNENARIDIYAKKGKAKRQSRKAKQNRQSKKGKAKCKAKRQVKKATQQGKARFTEILLARHNFLVKEIESTERQSSGFTKKISRAPGKMRQFTELLQHNFFD